jgi:hypothetical protein
LSCIGWLELPATQYRKDVFISPLMKRVVSEMKNKLAALSVFAAAVLSGCGGGDVPSPGSNGVLVSPGPLAGLFHGSTSTGRQVHAIALENGEYWLIYSPVGNPSVIAGAAQGHASSSNGAAFSNDFRDFNLEGAGITDGLLSASYFPKNHVTGNVIFPNSTLSFTAKYDFLYEATSSLRTVAGTFGGTAAVVTGIEPFTVTISTSGAITGASQSGCRFAGTATTHSGWIYTVSIAFAGAPCANGTSTVTGVAYYDPDSSHLISTALNSSRSNGFIFAGAKQ